jgi:glycosyltransferase involved in cell wall biosynthesis
MRVWLLTSELPPDVAGGIATYVDAFARTLGAAGHEVTVFAPGATASERIVAPGVRVVRFVPGASTRGADVDPYAFLAEPVATSHELAGLVLARAAREGPPDVIEAQEHLALPYYLVQRKLTERTPIADTPIVVHLHSPSFGIARANQEPVFRFPDYWIGQMEKFCVAAADALVAPSRFLADWYRDALGRELDVTCIPLPLTLPSMLAASPTPGDVVSIGRLEVRKGTLPLVRACDRLWEEGASFRLTLIGADRAYSPRATTVGAYLRERYRRRFEDGRLRHRDAVGRDEALAAMASAWVVVVPSLWENFPNTCMEAMGIGQVVLASTAGGQAEMIGTSGDAGVLFDWARPGEFEAALRTILALDVAAHRRIGETARRRISALCTPDRVCAARLEHYERVRQGRTVRRVFPSASLVAAPAFGDPPPEERAGLLSVVVPFHNLGAYLPKTLAAVAASTYEPREIVVVDDGSDDPTSVALLAHLEAGEAPLVRIVRGPNRGLAAARNAGADAARGEFVAFVDADDLVEPEFFARCIDVLRRWSNVGFVYSWTRYVGEHHGIWPTWNAEFPYLLGHNMLVPLVVVRRAWFREAGGNRSEMEFGLEDYEAWIRLLARGAAGVSLAAPLVRYRVRGDSMYRRLGPDALLHLYERMAELDPDPYRQWGPALAGLLNANGPGWTWDHPAVPAVDDDAARYDAELGRRLLQRVRDARVGRLLLRYGPVRRTIKRVLEL